MNQGRWMGPKAALLPIVGSVTLILALQACVWYLWIEMAEKSIETPLKQLLLTRGLRTNHVLNTTLVPVSFAQEVLCKCAPLHPMDILQLCGDFSGCISQPRSSGPLHPVCVHSFWERDVVDCHKAVQLDFLYSRVAAGDRTN